MFGRGRQRPKVGDLGPDRRIFKGPKNRRAFFKYLHQLLPEGSVIFIEGTRIAEDVRIVLQALQPVDVPEVRRCTLWPKPYTFHLPATAENLQELVRLLKSHAIWEVLDHIKAYTDQTMLLSWHDLACDDTPVKVSGQIDEAKIRSFFSNLGCNVERAGVSTTKA
ncbi:MAG: hypothetical protein LLG01_19150 [Planctomycetaceae bacterium]|nr:hypothetical protein [Planctomycetaceae bacterium]